MLATDTLKFTALFVAMNAFTFSVYLLDKEAARNGRRRISERTLLTLAFFGGSLGAIGAQRLLRHKTQKEPFRSILKAIAIFHIGAALLLVIGYGYATFDSL